MLDPKKIMIICKGEDKTAEITDYAFDDVSQKCLITFNTGQAYGYLAENISVLQAQPFDAKGKYIFSKGEPVQDIDKVFLFADGKHKFLRIFKVDGSYLGGAMEQFTITETADLSPDAEKIFSYLRTVAGLTKSRNEDNRSFLAKLYDNIDFIHPESVLSAYLNRHPITKKETRLDELIFPFRFNLSQKAALENALAYSVSVIEGPPGTGKTQTILNILANLTSELGKSVGVVSFNNEAVKNVKDKLDNQKYGFLVADLGRAEKRQAFFDNPPAIDVIGWDHEDSLIELQGSIKALNQILDRLLADDNRRAQLQMELAAYRLEQQHFEQYYAAQDVTNIKKLPFYTRSSDQVVEYLADIMLEDKLQQGLQFLHKLKLLFKYREFRWGKLKVGEVEALLNLQKKFYVLKINELEKECRILAENLTKHSFKDLQNEHQCLSERIFRKRLFMSHGGLKARTYTDKTYKSDFNNFSKHFPILLSTNHSLRNSLPPDCLLDYIIIDEASQVDLLTGVLALSCCRNLIIVGDLKQLPQIVEKNMEKKLVDWEVPAAYDYCKQSILSSFIQLYPEALPRVILKEHYRCHPAIIQFCNQKYYDGELIPFTDSSSCHVPLMLYKLPKGHHMRTVMHGDKTGNYNQRELDVITEEVLPKNLISRDIGYAVPYRLQVAKAKEYLPNEVKSDTVHKFQGRENDVIIMGTVLDGSARGKSGLSFVDEACLVNVAVSRAQKQFILVTDDSLFQNNGRHIHDLLRYIQYNTLDEHIIASQVVSVFDLLYKNYSEKLDYLKAKMFYKSRFDSENIIYAVLDEILAEQRYSHYSMATQVLVRNIIKNFDRLDASEITFVNNRASVDFVLYHKQDKRCALAIEVDSFAWHENNPEQLRRDKIKNTIFEKYDLPLLRLPTNGSCEKKKILSRLDEVDARYSEGVPH